MKRTTIITLVVILAIAGLISYGIIWYRKKFGAGSSAANTSENSNTQNSNSSSTKINTGPLVSTPKINNYLWWTNKLGHAAFPLGFGSRGVEVVKVQECLNVLTQAKRLTAGPIAVDGIWGNETDTRFKILFPGYSSISQEKFISEFDTNGDLFTKVSPSVTF